MASIFQPSTGPQCLRCLQRATIGSSVAWLASTRQQVRGKKKLAKSLTVKVRLLADIPRYGRQGSIVPIAAGRMRNELYPKRLAEYVTASHLRELGMLDSVFERDPTFGIGQPTQSKQPIEDAEAATAFEVDLLKPERAMKMVSMLLPPNIDFYRTPIATTPPPSKRHSPSIPETSVISAAAQEALQPQMPQKIDIYGSVTTADIAESVRAILAEDTEGARVVLSPEDISFVDEAEVNDRVKQLGIFEISIRVKGAMDNIRRTISINAQEHC